MVFLSISGMDFIRFLWTWPSKKMKLKVSWRLLHPRVLIPAVTTLAPHPRKSAKEAEQRNEKMIRDLTGVWRKKERGKEKKFRWQATEWDRLVPNFVTLFKLEVADGPEFSARPGPPFHFLGPARNTSSISRPGPARPSMTFSQI